MRILLTGITGYVGSVLAPRLVRDGHELRGLARNPGDSAIPLVQGDVVTGRGLERALDGIDVAYYLIHSMEAGANGAFTVQERVAAENFAHAARASRREAGSSTSAARSRSVRRCHVTSPAGSRSSGSCSRRRRARSHSGPRS